MNDQIPVEQVQTYLEQLERQKSETVHQSVHGNSGKATALMRPAASTMNYSSFYHSPTAYSSCLMTSPASKTADDLTVYHAEQLGSCLGQADGAATAGNPGAVVPMVGSSMKPEIGLKTGDSECFTARGQQCVGATYTPVDVHRAGNADSSTCLYSRYIANH